jgi:hypothetical protein
MADWRMGRSQMQVCHLLRWALVRILRQLVA